MRASLVVALLALAGCADFEAARQTYEEKLQVRDAGASARHPDGIRCVENDECASNQCTDGFCRSGPPGPNQTCNQPDCASGLVCEPVADLYLCENPGCAAIGRLCQGDFACQNGCDAPLSCRNGTCQVAACTEGAACASNAGCCDGFACRADAGCTPADAGELGGGFFCTSAAECASGECGNNGQCRADAGTCNHIGVGCANNCCAGLECSVTEGVCCLGNARVCLADTDCCSRQCLDGVCAQENACRQRGLPCTDATDCCTGKCDPAQRKCVGADGGL